MQQITNEIIDSKIKQAQENINNTYRQYLNDLEDIKLLAPQDKHAEIEALIVKIDTLHEHLCKYANFYLRPFVTKHIRTILAQDKMAAPANDILSESRRTA